MSRREEIARVIDPCAFNPVQHKLAPGPEWTRRQKEALAKADTIVSAYTATEAAANLFNDLFNSPHFQVQIGGNPILVERMLDRIEGLYQQPLPPLAQQDER